MAERMSNPVDILVLEDQETRIEWLSANMASSLTIMWAHNYVTFEGSLHLRPRVIILDHDLGTPETGYDAARLLPDRVDKETPIIIWSQNPVGSNSIKQFLDRQGFRLVAWLPFGLKNQYITTSLVSILR